MNSLKFIDTEIKCCYLNINKAKEENLYQKTLSILIPENKNINLAVLNDLQISLNEEKIKFFQQIKSELEAWYEIKNLYLKGYFSRVALPNESDKKFKKALEVEDDK